MKELSELPSRLSISPETLRWYRQEFPNLIAIERLSKIAYPSVPIDICLAEGGDIAAGSDRIHAYLDCDKRLLSRCLKEVACRTMTIKTTKGWCFIVDIRHGIPEDILTQIIDMKASKYLYDVENLEQAQRDLEYWNSLGFTDDTSIHGWNFELRDILNDKRLLEKPYQDYVLLPPSITCRYQGYNGHVRDHSTTFSNFCNQSPDRRHHWVERTWFNKTAELLTFSEFWEIVWNGRAN